MLNPFDTAYVGKEDGPSIGTNGKSIDSSRVLRLSGLVMIAQVKLEQV
jgi:hypothetical protein